jgi:peptide chain release factor 2
LTKSSICETLFDLGDKQLRRDELNREMESPTFWNDAEKAKGVIQELKTLNGVLKPL